jgi:hypothetical protein
MGNRVAELQLRIIWEEILKRFSKVEVVGAPERTLSNFIRGFTHMPVKLYVHKSRARSGALIRDGAALAVRRENAPAGFSPGMIDKRKNAHNHFHRTGRRRISDCGQERHNREGCRSQQQCAGY